MSVYQFHFIGAGERRPTLDFAHCEDDGAAVREAFGQLNQHHSAHGLEVWNGDRMVLRMDRFSPPASAAVSPIHGVR